MRSKQRVACLTVGALLLASCQQLAMREARFAPLVKVTHAELRGLHVLDARVAWATGSNGTVLRTLDGGRSFDVRQVADASRSELRDVHAFDPNAACLLACQPARIYRTDDAGRHFDEVWRAPDDAAFLDALAFFDPLRGIAFGDPDAQGFLILWTADGGRTWHRVPATAVPQPLPGEGAFAASGTCLVARKGGHVWAGTGVGGARVLASTDHGHSWGVATTPLAHGKTAGVFSLAFRDERVGVAVGGDYQLPERAVDHAALTHDGGRSWTPIAGQAPRGYRSCVAFVPSTAATLVTVGPTGSDYSTDGGETWLPLGDTGYHVIAFASDGTGFAAGEAGRIARLVR